MTKKRAPSKRARTERREAERAGVKLAESRLKLALLEPGGSPDRPIEVTSASVVEPHATGLGCAACGGATRIEEHSAVTLADRTGAPRSLRVARVRCARCGVTRDVYFRLQASTVN
ncbi:MAG TPA: hypothetical protein VM204_09580 [Gaiellaceae bacterium]|nr:hypothetical protein [Gaiellaceae bacterium]